MNPANAPILAGLLAAAACVLPPAIALAAPRSASPQRKSDAAAIKEHTRSGETKFEVQDYAGALADFQAVEALKSTPQIVRQIGRCHDKLGQYPEAVAAYERFVTAAPASLAKEAEEIRKRVEEIKAMRGALHIETTPPGATVVVDGYAEAQLTPVDVSLVPGRHSLHLTRDGQEPEDRDVEVGYGSHSDMKIQLSATAAPTIAEARPVLAAAASPPSTLPMPPPLPPEHHGKAQAFVTGGLAVAAAGVGAAFGVIALGDRNAFNANPTTAGANATELHELICDVAFGAAITLGITSVVLFLKNDDAPKKTTLDGRRVTVARGQAAPFSVAVAPIVTLHGLGTGVRLVY